MIDQVDDNQMLSSYIRLLEREGQMDPKDPFKNTDEDMMARAKKSIQSVDAGRNRSIKDFRADVELWKKKTS